MTWYFFDGRFEGFQCILCGCIFAFATLLKIQSDTYRRSSDSNGL